MGCRGKGRGDGVKCSGGLEGGMSLIVVLVVLEMLVVLGVKIFRYSPVVRSRQRAKCDRSKAGLL